MRVLGTCATKNGSMQQLAEAIAATLRASELGVDVLRARGGCLPPAWAYGGARITAVAVRGGVHDDRRWVCADRDRLFCH
jgi:menaquinone-dependent protoporphyrinogen IX oxidase